MKKKKKKKKSKKKVLTTAETCCSMESSASKVTPRVFTTLENGMDASPTDRQLAGTVSLLDDGPLQFSAHCVLVCFSSSIFVPVDSTQRTLSLTQSRFTGERMST